MEHRFIEYRKTPLQISGFNRDGSPNFMEDPFEETATMIGCDACDMGVAEAMANPDCLGISLEDMVEQD